MHWKWLSWTLGGMAVAFLLYCLAIGPVSVLMQRKVLPPWTFVIYTPFFDPEGGIRPHWLEEPAIRYILAWGRWTHTSME